MQLSNKGSCYLCRENNLELSYKLNSRIIYKCQNDHLFFSNDDQKLDKSHYNNDYYESSPYSQTQIFEKPYFKQKLTELISLINVKNPFVLDVGCGWGNFLQVLKESHLPYLGIDLSPVSIKICKQKNLNCNNTDLIEMSKRNNKYSIITFFQVIEHMKDPISYLQVAKKLLKKDGVILLTTPNNDSPFRFLLGSNWPVYNTPSHYFFYSKETLMRLFKKAGFSKFIIKIDKPRLFSLKYIIERVFRKKILSGQLDFPVPTDPWGDLEAIIYK